jgi:phage repressor protein C with HTH and peptisase S24 domain
MSRDLRKDLFADRVAEAIGDNVLEFARRAGLLSIQRSIANWKANPASIKPENLILIAKAADRPISWFYGEEPPGTVMIPVLDVQAAAGNGSIVDVVRAEAEFAFPFYFLQRLLGDLAGRARLSSLRSRGNSMEPTIMDRALLIIDEAQRDLPKLPSSAKMQSREPDIFVFFTSDGLRLKRLTRIDEDFFAIISDNIHEHPPQVFKPGRDGKITIIGKVIWWDNRL